MKKTTVNAAKAFFCLLGFIFNFSTSYANGAVIVENTVPPPPPLGINVTFTNVTCNGFNNGSATAFATGGISPYTYLWSPGGATTSSVSALSPSVDTILVTDNTGDTLSATIRITQAPVLYINQLTVINLLCYGNLGSASANHISGGETPYTYQWNDPHNQTTQTASALSAGSYTVTVTDNYGCSVMGIATIAQPAQVIVSIPTITNPKCNGDAVTLTAKVALDTITKTFSDDTVVQNFKVPPGITTMTITASGGQGGGSGGLGATVRAIVSMTPGHVLSLVAGGQGALFSSANSPLGNGGGGGSFVYDSTTGILFIAAGGGGGASWQGNAGGTGGIDLIHNLTTSGGGADGTAPGGTLGSGGLAGNGAISDSGRNPGPGGAGWLGNGQSVTSGGIADGGNDHANDFVLAVIGSTNGGFGGGGAGTFDCGGGGGGFNGGGGGNDDTAEKYSGGGGGGGSYLMSSATLLGSPIANQIGNGIITIQYIDTGGVSPYTYNWSPVGGTSIATYSITAGTYTITVTDHNGCTGTASASITQPLPVLVNPTVISNEPCYGDKSGSALVLPTQGVTPYTYLWTNGYTNNIVTGLSAGSYTIIVTDNNGCMGTAHIAITTPSALSLLPGSKISSGCNSSAWVAPSGATPPYTYLWTPGGETTDTIKNLCPDNYCCTVTDSNGCMKVTCINISATGLTQITNNEQVNVYPNPASNQITIRFNGNGKGNLISLYNIPGQKIYEQQCNCQSSIINCESFPGGVYFLKIIMQDGITFVKKVEIVK
jgi:hypothetical protein